MRKLLWSFSGAGMKLVYLIFCDPYNVMSTDREVLIKANIISFSVILREKLQVMYNFNRFVAFMPLFCAQLKLVKAVHR